MPSHLHPRSTATSTLFAGTLLASFVVVAVPHIWPCPRPRKAYLDSEVVFDDQGRPLRRVRRVTKKENNQEEEEPAANSPPRSSAASRPSPNQKGNTIQDEAKLLQQLQAEAAALEQENARRECPVPKPRGALGRLLGFEEKQGNSHPK